eukprot:IDg8297t1
MDRYLQNWRHSRDKRLESTTCTSFRQCEGEKPEGIRSNGVYGARKIWNSQIDAVCVHVDAHTYKTDDGSSRNIHQVKKQKLNFSSKEIGMNVWVKDLFHSRNPFTAVQCSPRELFTPNAARFTFHCPFSRASDTVNISTTLIPAAFKRTMRQIEQAPFPFPQNRG